MGSASSTREETLAGAWHPAVRRILFFTYRFNFRWFHDCVLSLARRQNLDGVQIDVLATKREEDQGRLALSGDLYALDQWAKLQKQVRLHYMRPRRHLFHNKFILVEHARTGTIEIGVGSSNLTSGGWGRNFETWTWSRNAGLQACGAFLDYLRDLPDVDARVFAPWLKQLSNKKPEAWHWLWGNKAERARKTLSALGSRLNGPARVVRIASPYFDKESVKLLEQLLVNTGVGSNKPKLEFWIDGSASVSRPIDYEIIGQLANRYGPSCRVMKVISKASARDLGRAVPLHAKVIELQGTERIVSRLLGSANFTGAAWLKTWNTESLQLECDRQSLETLLAPGQLIVPVSRRELRSLRDEATEGDGDSPETVPCIYWAAFDETTRPRTLTVCYQADRKPSNFAVEAAFDPSRDKLPGKSERDAIVAAFQNRTNWSESVAQLSQSGLLRLSFLGNTPVPEQAQISLRFSNGRTLQGPIEIMVPDFSKRDANTGIPIAPSIEAILGKGEPIVPPRTSRTLAELAGVVDDDDEEIPPAVPEDRLGADPDYRREPLAVRMAKLLKRIKGNPARAQHVKEQCDATAALPLRAGELALVRALKKAVSA